MGCGGGDGERRFYMITAAGIAKIVAIVTGVAPLILAFILYNYYTHYPRPDSAPHIRIHKDQREVWEIGFLIVVAASVGITILNLLFYTCFKCLSTNIWTKRFDCGYLAIGGSAQAIVGFIMLASALTSRKDDEFAEPVEMKFAAGFLGILTGIIYWGSATLVNRD